MDLGYLEFNCNDRNCNVEIQLGKVIWEFCLVIISFKQNANIQVSLKSFGFDSPTVEKFKSFYIAKGSRDGTMKVHPAISSKRNAQGDEFVNIFEKF